MSMESALQKDFSYWKQDSQHGRSEEGLCGPGTQKEMSIVQVGPSEIWERKGKF